MKQKLLIACAIFTGLLMMAVVVDSRDQIDLESVESGEGTNYLPIGYEREGSDPLVPVEFKPRQYIKVIDRDRHIIESESAVE
ncbi:hypothetical protein R3398_15925 [Rossellomorea marisflavi]|uniref:hypothetical protein n=1 Tax=Rossellomorea marisflavi TaxID=189381 RepID=UPI0009A8F64E|nr:hypothetical protein [Rossellomorea marisflavi]MDW4527853.1 hypothetical protein [Rossellomorea marisflavi]